MQKKLNIFPRIVTVLVGFLLLITVSQNSYAQLGKEAQRVSWIRIVANSFTWPNEDTIQTFTVGVFGNNAPEFAVLNNLVQKNDYNIKQKPVKAVHFRRMRDVVPTDIIYVSHDYYNQLPEISERIGDHPTVIIVDSCSQAMEKYCMVNLLFQGKQPLKLQSPRMLQSKLDCTDELKRQGGSKSDLLDMNDSYSKNNQEKENELLVLEADLNRRLADLQTQMLNNDIQSNQINERKDLLLAHEVDIEIERKKADSLANRAENLRRVSEKNRYLIDQQKKEIAERRKATESILEDIEDQKSKIAGREEAIKLQEEKLKDQDKTKDFQRTITIIGISAAVVVLVLIIIITISNISRKKKNRQLEAKNDEVDRQKDLIQAQSEQLLQINKGLEKLSIVASQTDNGVVIMDNLGNIEWVNRGFTNMYGYTAKDLIAQAQDCLTGFYSKNPDIQTIKDDCLSNSQPRVFECEIITKQGKSVWIQSTLTPILDENNQIGRLVTIDTDITQIKEQELAIMRQGVTLASQRDELAQQNEFIKEQNAHISTSLTYAKTIQETVMPLEVNITKYFKYFGIFIPLQIVSGDFYWFTRVPDDDRIAFTAAVDCTGHGVPGAFMCMITTRILSEIIVEHHIYDTKEILNSLNAGLVAALKQDETDNNDSLEICLCKFTHIDDENYEMSFSGAKRPLYIYHDDTQQFDILKGDRKTIGGLMSKRNATEFTSEVVVLRKNDKIYMTSDGFVNQFDINNKKYGSERLVTLLKSIAPMALPDQKIVLEQEYANHRGAAEQNDDVTVFAVQLI